jgi:tektin-2
MAATQSVVQFEKPLKHLSLNDWNLRVSQLRNNSETKRLDAFNLRQVSKNLRNESTVESFWSTYYNNERFSDRVAELDRWRQTLIECYNRIEKEIQSLKNEKEITEKSLESQIQPLIVVSECISQRDVRLAPELTLDSVDEEMNTELCIVESNKRLLRDQCQAGEKNIDFKSSNKLPLFSDVQQFSIL